MDTPSIIKRALTISPNLDELLEHEDRTRARLVSAVSVSEMNSPRSVSPTRSDGCEEILVGLPPPPRHPRVKLPRPTTYAIKTSLILSESTELQARETPAKPAPTSFVQSPLSGSSSISNPFINPAPTLAELHDIPSKLPVTQQPSNGQSSELSSYRSDSRDRTQSPIVFTSPWSAVDVNPPIQSSRDRRPQQNFVADSHSKPWQPLNSLNSQAKRPSTSPGYTTFTHISSTLEPVNTSKAESCISISTTVYPPSDKGSYSFHDPVYSSSGKSHSQSQREVNSTSMDCPQISPIQFSRRLSDTWVSFTSDPSRCSPLSPDLPTTPISRSTSTKIRPLPPIPTASEAPLPPTTNFLDSGERADLVRTTRKLARVFGKTPGADVITVQDPSLSMSRHSSGSDWSQRPSALQTELELDEARRHSAPLSPDDVSSVTSSSQESLLSPSKDQAGHHAQAQIMSVNDTFDGGDTASIMLEADKITKPFTYIPSQSQLGTTLDEEQADERRRKREKLAKLHRFLGSRIPINLILGTEDNVEASLPPPFFSPISPLNRNDDRQTTWLKRRKSSSAILSSPHWSNDLERVKEELNEQEKFINVRRAVKMEKVFGVAPPQTLYHTRLCPSPLSLANKSSPIDGPSPTGSAQRYSSRSAYTKLKLKKNSRPGTADSDMHLVPKAQETSHDVADVWEITHSTIYNSYQYSLNSLQDILTRDDRESLVELHQYLNTEEEQEILSPFEVSPMATERRMSNASSFGRRRSLPALTSRVSFDSEYNVTAPEMNVTGFQVRRRKAAKLTQFFGVDYRELINDVLQSIENGVKNEHKSGTLRAEEVEDLLARLRKLKVRRPRTESFLCMD